MAHEQRHAARRAGQHRVLIGTPPVELGVAVAVEPAVVAVEQRLASERRDRVVVAVRGNDDRCRIDVGARPHAKLNVARRQEDVRLLRLAYERQRSAADQHHEHGSGEGRLEDGGEWHTLVAMRRRRRWRPCSATAHRGPRTEHGGDHADVHQQPHVVQLDVVVLPWLEANERGAHKDRPRREVEAALQRRLEVEPCQQRHRHREAEGAAVEDARLDEPRAPPSRRARCIADELLGDRARDMVAVPESVPLDKVAARGAAQEQRHCRCVSGQPTKQRTNQRTSQRTSNVHCGVLTVRTTMRNVIQPSSGLPDKASSGR